MSRRRGAALAVALGIGVMVTAASGVWSSAGHTNVAIHTRVTTNQDHRTTTRRPTSTLAAARRAPFSPGSLSQTRAYPSGHSDRFRSRMSSLWAGIVGDSLQRALPAFFPRAAYLQLKAMGNAGSDWTDRLLHDYSLDISAAHRLLGPDAAAATLLGVHVKSSYGHWVAPGACYNSVGYYEMPGARIVYRERSGVHSFGIASMISWRGEWYVVHLGAVLRSTDKGVVDEPAVGPGAPRFSGTC